MALTPRNQVLPKTNMVLIWVQQSTLRSNA